MTQKETVAEFETLSDAEKAVMALDREGFPMAIVSILAKDVEDEPTTEEPEQFWVVVDGDSAQVKQARDILKQTEAEAVEVQKES